MSEGVGRKTDLTEELRGMIKQSILDGNNLKKTSEFCFNKLEEFNNLIEEERKKELANFTQKIYNWNYNNYLNISEKIEGWRRDRKLMLAEKNIEEMLLMDDQNTRVIENKKKGDYEITFRDSSLTRIKADISKFVAETLGKNNYAKRQELSGKDGKDLIIPIYGGRSNISKHDRNEKDISVDEENKGGIGGNIGE